MSVGDGGDAGSGDARAPAHGDGGGTTADAGPAAPCTVTFHFTPAAGQTVGTVQVRGEWDGFGSPGVALLPDGAGSYSGSLSVLPGLVAYKLVVDGNWQLDPSARFEKYVGGTENSAVNVADCHVPSLAAVSTVATRASAGQGRVVAEVAFVPSVDGGDLDETRVSASLRKDGVSTPVSGTSALANGHIGVDVGALGDGKYTLFVDAADTAGRAAPSLRLVFWIEAAPFDWHDALIYMVMLDRFRDGDPSNDITSPTPNVDPRVDWQGGDLAGVKAAISDGTFDKLGVTALWLSPFNTNPSDPYLAADNFHNVTGYHGYWPIKAREVDPKLGGADALKALVKEAHAHGIRILQDNVIQHVHQEHEYLTQHPDWFHSGCLCGSDNCDWTVHRLDCIFASYLPDVDWTVPEVSQQFSDDAAWWIDTFDLDGFRLDAVKQVPNIAVINLTAHVRDQFEASGTEFFFTGETAMGWSDCGLACNADQYGTISQFIGPHGLDGQEDFVLYYAVPTTVFADDTHGMIHVDYWSQQSQLQYPNGAIMSPYTGTQDTARFVTLASYRNQDGAHGNNIPGNQWDNIAQAPPDENSYQRQRLALAWLLGLPGAPVIYYGDEYSEWGGSDPNNRVMWRGNGTLDSDEQATLSLVRKLGTARQSLAPLRRGAYVPVYSTEEVLVFARQTATDTALVALSRAADPTTFTAPIAPSLNLGDGTVLHDRLGGADVTVTGAAITLTLGGYSAAYFGR